MGDVQKTCGHHSLDSELVGTCEESHSLTAAAPSGRERGLYLFTRILGSAYRSPCVGEDIAPFYLQGY